MVARHFEKRKSLYPFMSKAASVFDFGLSPSEEERAAELHKTIQVYDGLMECTYYPGLVENILAGGSQVGGSLSLGNAGCEENIESAPEKWWT